MSSIEDVFRSLFPGFHEARRERNRIRNRYRENINALRRGDNVYTINKRDYSPEYLQNWVQERQSQADHLIVENGSPSGTNSYQINQNSDEIEAAIMLAIRAIRIQNWISLAVEVILIVFIAMAIGLAIFLGLAGADVIIDQAFNSSA